MINTENLEGVSLAQINLLFRAVREFMQVFPSSSISDLKSSSKSSGLCKMLIYFTKM